jgi:hypothetical protein
LAGKELTGEITRINCITHTIREIMAAKPHDCCEGRQSANWNGGSSLAAEPALPLRKAPRCAQENEIVISGTRRYSTCFNEATTLPPCVQRLYNRCEQGDL